MNDKEQDTRVNEIPKAFVTQEAKITITCPKCKKKQDKDVSQFMDIDQAVRLKTTCPCGHVFRIDLERRNFVRKPVRLNGTIHYDGQQYPAVVADLSRKGLNIRITDAIDVTPGDKIQITFVLDDANHSRVSKELTVRKAGPGTIGAEFVSLDHYDRLGPYLLFQIK